MIEYQIIEIKKLTDIEKIKDDWNELLNLNQSKNPYIDPDFYTRLFPSRAGNAVPQIILFKNNNKPISLIIGWLKKKKISLKLGYLRFNSLSLKTLEIEIGGLITDNNTESKLVTIEYLKNILLQNEIELLIANHFAKNSIFYQHLVSGLSFKNKSIYNPSVEWYTNLLDGNTGKEIIHHSNKTRQKFRRLDRIFLNRFPNAELKLINSKEELGFFINNAEKVSKKNYHQALGVGVENNTFWNDMFIAMAEGGYFRGYLLMSDDEPIAYYQGVVYKNIFYAFTTSYNSDYREFAPGSYILRRIISLFIDEKITIFHFGYGDAEYKKLYGDTSLEEATFRIYGFTKIAKIIRLIDITTIVVNKTFIDLLQKTKWLNKIKKIWRKRLINK